MNVDSDLNNRNVYLLVSMIIFFSEETVSSKAGALYKPMAKLSATVMEQKIKAEFSQAKPTVRAFLKRPDI